MSKWRITMMTMVLLFAALGIARAVKLPYIGMPEGTYYGPRQEALNADPSKGFGDSLLGIGLFIGEKQELTICRDREKISLQRQGQGNVEIYWRKEVGATEVYDAKGCEWRNGLWCIDVKYSEKGKCVWAVRHFVVFDKLYNQPGYRDGKDK